MVFVLARDDFDRHIGACTGTLISPSHVLTAAHCLTAWNRRSPIVVRLGVRADSPGGRVGYDDEVAVAACVLHPDFNIGFPTAIGECGGSHVLDGVEIGPRQASDLAILRLSRPVPVSWATPSASVASFQTDFHRLLDSADARPAFGDPVSIVGYGLTVLVDPGALTLGTRHYAPGEIQSVGGGLLTTRDGAPGTLGGDSGGPALWDLGRLVSNRLLPVIGVASLKPTEGVGHDYAGVVDASNLEWVRSQRDLDGNGVFDYGCADSSLGFDPTATPVNDLDGDGILNGPDNCPVAYNPCQEDVDGDLFGDQCDSCPTVWNGEAAQEEDGDTDGRADACDNCPGTPNPLQEDGDVDLSCDPEASDSFCSHFVPDGVGDACDNCDAIPNPLQENCNVDAERATGAAEWGDACDPVPCGETTLWSRDVPPPPGGMAQNGDG